MKKLLLRIALLAPWIFLIWLISQGISGAISGIMVFFLLFLLIPGTIFMNLVTVVFFQGHAAMRIIKNAQGGGKTLESTNYSDLPWWNPKRWM